MRSVTWCVVIMALVGASTVAAIAGCGASGVSDPLVDDGQPTAAKDPTEGAAETRMPSPPPPGATSGASPADSTAPGSSSTDAGKGSKEAGAGDAGFDAGSAPVPGTACSALGDIRQRFCGRCGRQSTRCVAVDDAGTAVWADYDPCDGEAVDGCLPGESTSEPCGNCGTLKKTCGLDCKWNTTTCSGQPLNACTPGTVDTVSAGCPTPGTYASRTCSDTCVWGGFSACEEPNNPNKMTASATEGEVVSATWTFDKSLTTKRPDACNSSGTLATRTYPYVAVEVTNPTAQRMSVTIYHTASKPNAPQKDTYIWVYRKVLAPTTDAALRACDWGVADSCLTTNPCNNDPSNYVKNWAGIDKVTIGPNGKVLVFSSTGGSTTDLGDFNLNVRTDKLQ